MGYIPQTPGESEDESGSSNETMKEEKKPPLQGIQLLKILFSEGNVLCEVVRTKWGLDPRLFNLKLTLKQS